MVVCVTDRFLPWSHGKIFHLPWCDHNLFSDSLKKDLVYLVQEVWQALMEIFELIKLGPTTPTSIGTSSDQFPWDNATHLLK